MICNKGFPLKPLQANIAMMTSHELFSPTQQHLNKNHTKCCVTHMKLLPMTREVIWICVTDVLCDNLIEWLIQGWYFNSNAVKGPCLLPELCWSGQCSQHCYHRFIQACLPAHMLVMVTVSVGPCHLTVPVQLLSHINRTFSTLTRTNVRTQGEQRERRRTLVTVIEWHNDLWISHELQLGSAFRTVDYHHIRVNESTVSI